VTQPATIAPERAFVIGNPLVDVVQRHARSALAAAAWRRYDLSPGAYNFAVLTGRASFAAVAPRLTQLAAARTPLILEAPDGYDVPGAVTVGDRSFLQRLSLERAAKTIFTDSERVHEEATVLGVPCHSLDAARDLPAASTSWEGPAGIRAADAFVSNFARVRLGV
jgi:UDP-N-acetylglucosamine 2-epimerase